MGCCASESNEIPRYVPKSTKSVRADSASPPTGTAVGLLDDDPHCLPLHQPSDGTRTEIHSPLRKELELSAQQPRFRPPPDVLVRVDDSIATGHRRLSQFLGSASRTTITPDTNTPDQSPLNNHNNSSVKFSPSLDQSSQLMTAGGSSVGGLRPKLNAFDGSGSASRSEYSTDWSTLTPGDTDTIMNSVSLRFQATSLRHQPSEEHPSKNNGGALMLSPFRTSLSSKKKKTSSRMDKVRMSLRVTSMQSKSTRLRMSEMFDWTRRWLTVDFLAVCPKVLAPVDIAVVIPVISRFWHRKMMNDESQRNRVLFAQSILELLAVDSEFPRVSSKMDCSSDAAKKHLKFLDELIDMLCWLHNEMSNNKDISNDGVSDRPGFMSSASNSRASQSHRSTSHPKRESKKRSSKVTDLRDAVSLFMAGSSRTVTTAAGNETYQGIRVSDQSASSALSKKSVRKSLKKIGSTTTTTTMKKKSSLEGEGLTLKSIKESDSLSSGGPSSSLSDNDESEVAWLVTNGRICALMEAHFKSLGLINHSRMKESDMIADALLSPTPSTILEEKLDRSSGMGSSSDTSEEMIGCDITVDAFDTQSDDKSGLERGLALADSRSDSMEKGQVIPTLDAMVASDPGRLSAVMEDEPDSLIEIEEEDEDGSGKKAGSKMLMSSDTERKMGEDLEAYSREIEKKRSMEPMRLSPASSSKAKSSCDSTKSSTDSPSVTPATAASDTSAAVSTAAGAGGRGIPGLFSSSSSATSSAASGSSSIDDSFSLDRWQWMYCYVRCFLTALEKFFGSRLTIREQYSFDLLWTGIGSVLSGSPVMEYRIQELMEIRRLVTECSDWPVIKVYCSLVSSNISALGYISRLLNLRFFPVCAKLFRFYRTLLLDMPHGNEESHKRIVHSMFVEICDRIRNPMVEEVPSETRQMIEEMHSVVCGCLSELDTSTVTVIHESKGSGIMITDSLVDIEQHIPVHKMCLECLNSMFQPLFIDESLMLDLISSFKW